MDVKKIALIGLGGWLLYRLTQTVQTGLALANFKVTPASFNIHSVDKKGVVLRADMNIDNLSDQVLYLNAIMMQVSMNGKYLGSKNLQIRSYVQPFRTLPLRASLTVPYMTLLSLLWNYAQQNRSSYPVSIGIAGYVVANNQSFPFSNNFSVDIPSLPQIMDGISNISNGLSNAFDFSKFQTQITTPTDESSSTITQGGEPANGNA